MATAIDCDEHGWMHVLGVPVVDTEPRDSRRRFPEAVRGSGVSGVVLV